MWLPDANIDIHLSNGQLVGAAVATGFSCLLTRDRLFGESASRALRSHPDFAVVLVSLPQKKWPIYLEEFQRAWARIPITPLPGELIEWPEISPSGEGGGDGADGALEGDRFGA